MKIEILKRAAPTPPRTPFPAGLIHRLVRELAEDADLRVEVAVAGRYCGCPGRATTSGGDRPPSGREVADGQVSTTIAEIHAASRDTYGAPREHAELRLGLGMACGRKRVVRLMPPGGSACVCHWRKHRRKGPAPAVHEEDLVQRRFIADRMRRAGRRRPLVVDALETARWRRRPPVGAVVHSDRGQEHVLDLSVTDSGPPACSARWVGSPPAPTTA